jgi:hypothetical protein
MDTHEDGSLRAGRLHRGLEPVRRMDERWPGRFAILTTTVEITKRPAGGHSAARRVTQPPANDRP